MTNIYIFHQNTSVLFNMLFTSLLLRTNNSVLYLYVIIKNIQIKNLSHWLSITFILSLILLFCSVSLCICGCWRAGARFSFWRIIHPERKEKKTRFQTNHLTIMGILTRIISLTHSLLSSLLTRYNNYYNSLLTRYNNYYNSLLTRYNNYYNSLLTRYNNYYNSLLTRCNNYYNSLSTTYNNYYNSLLTSYNNYYNSLLTRYNNYYISLLV